MWDITKCLQAIVKPQTELGFLPFASWLWTPYRVSTIWGGPPLILLLYIQIAISLEYLTNWFPSQCSDSLAFPCPHFQQVLISYEAQYLPSQSFSLLVLVMWLADPVDWSKIRRFHNDFGLIVLDKVDTFTQEICYLQSVYQCPTKATSRRIGPRVEI